MCLRGLRAFTHELERSAGGLEAISADDTRRPEEIAKEIMIFGAKGAKLLPRLPLIRRERLFQSHKVHIDLRGFS